MLEEKKKRLFLYLSSIKFQKDDKLSRNDSEIVESSLKWYSILAVIIVLCWSEEITSRCQDVPQQWIRRFGRYAQCIGFPEAQACVGRRDAVVGFQSTPPWSCSVSQFPLMPRAQTKVQLSYLVDTPSMWDSAECSPAMLGKSHLF